jgi:hypothetical protein
MAKGSEIVLSIWTCRFGHCLDDFGEMGKEAGRQWKDQGKVQGADTAALLLAKNDTSPRCMLHTVPSY